MHAISISQSLMLHFCIHDFISHFQHTTFISGLASQNLGLGGQNLIGGQNLALGGQNLALGGQNLGLINQNLGQLVAHRAVHHALARRAVDMDMAGKSYKMTSRL